MLKFDTHNVRSYLLWKLSNTPQVAKTWHDDSDIILASLQTGEKIMFHLNERFADLHDIKTTLNGDTQAGRHTLMLFWADMLLPDNGERFTPNEWMQAALELYSERIYAFDIYAKDVHVFPVHFQKQAGKYERLIRYGREIDFAKLNCQTITVDIPVLKGTWKIAGFHAHTVDQPSNGNTSSTHSQPKNTTVPVALHGYYHLLKLELSASPEAIRKAYREMARQYHPDLNKAADAGEKMKYINEAYQKIMAQFSG